MESPRSKRQMNFQSAPQHADPVIASLSTIGMRIRKAVSEGYSMQSPYSYNPQFYNDIRQSQDEGGIENSTPRTVFERTPLPSSMTQPPALTNEGSTFQSGSNVSDWGVSNMVNITTIPSLGTKRKYEAEPEFNTGFGGAGNFNDYKGDIMSINDRKMGSFASWEEFSQNNGSFQFDEEF